LMFQGGFRVRSRDSQRGGGSAAAAVVIALVLIAVAWLLSIVIRFALSRQREFLADAGSVELTKNPDAMIMALRKIEGRGELPGATSAVMEMCVDNPREDFSNLFDTHPSVEARVNAIVKYAGGHDPGPWALAEPEQAEGTDEPIDQQAESEPANEPPGGGPWGPPGEAQTGAEKPFLPSRPPIELGEAPPPGEGGGPWGRKAGS
jgi:heat shock protein HtpX